MRKVYYGAFADRPYIKYEPYVPIGMKKANEETNREIATSIRYEYYSEEGRIKDATIMEKILARIRYALSTRKEKKTLRYRSHYKTAKSRRERFLEDNKVKTQGIEEISIKNDALDKDKAILDEQDDIKR